MTDSSQSATGKAGIDIAVGIPSELRKRPQWVLWKYEAKDGKQTKVPYSVRGYRASSTNPKDWCSFTVAYAERAKYDGIGYILTPDDSYVGVDLDGCIDTDGKLATWAVVLVAKLADVSYGEISPSGTGIKFLVRGKKPTTKCTYVIPQDERSGAEGKQQIECYEKSRFWTMTGNVYGDAYHEVRDGQAAVDWLADKYLTSKKKQTAKPKKPPSDSSPSKVLERAKKYLAEMPGAISGSGGSVACLKAAIALVKGFELSEEAAFQLLDGDYNHRCEPPWSDDELRHKVESAAASDIESGYILNAERDSSSTAGGNNVADDGRVCRPEVMVTLNEGFVADQVVEHMGSVGWASDWLPRSILESCKVYVRGGALVHAIPSESPDNIGQLGIRPLPTCLIRERVLQSCRLMIEKKVGETREIVPTHPPKWLVDSIDKRGYYNGKIRPLVGIIHAPTIRPDGSILQIKGYDDATGLLYVPSASFPKVPENPSREDAAKAMELLFDAVVDFPWLDPADRSAWLSLALTMIGRCCVRGCVPLFAVTANIRGAGKSLLADAGSITAYGRPAARKTFTRDDDELRKVITSIALEATPSVLFDNLDVQLGGASLDAALTAETWSDRVLGSSRMTGELPMRTVWCATGNNMAFGSDVGRRVLPIRLQSPLEKPEDRAGFKHCDLLGWVQENRPQLAVAALTILRAYFVAGCPPQPGGQWGSFEAWSSIIRGAIVWAGAADPLVTRATATENDDSRNLLGMLIAGLIEADPDGQGLTTKQIERLCTHRPDDVPTCPTLVEAVSLICGDRFNAQRFGKRMRSYVGRIHEGRRIDGKKGHGGVSLWIVRATNSVFGGSGGGFGGSVVGVQMATPTTFETAKHGENTQMVGVVGVFPNPIREMKESLFVDAPRAERGPGETLPPLHPLPPSQPIGRHPCPRCGADMTPAPIVDGWRNWDCPRCGHVKPKQVKQQVAQ